MKFSLIRIKNSACRVRSIDLGQIFFSNDHLAVIIQGRGSVVLGRIEVVVFRAYSSENHDSNDTIQLCFSLLFTTSAMDVGFKHGNHM